jgi:hypothetical protein
MKFTRFWGGMADGRVHAGAINVEAGGALRVSAAEAGSPLQIKVDVATR